MNCFKCQFLKGSLLFSNDNDNLHWTLEENIFIFLFFQLFSIYKSLSNFVSVQFTNITKKPVLNECKTIWSSTFHASSFKRCSWQSQCRAQLPGLEFSSTWNRSNNTYTFMVHIQTPWFDMIILTFMKRLKNSSLLVWV